MKLLTLILILLFPLCSFADEVKYTNKSIVNAIFLAEGGYKAQYLYGIRSIPYKDEAEARQIARNTVKNQRRRHAKHKCDKSYLECLSARYAPLEAQNDPKGLNANWLKNVLYFLNRK